MLKVKKSLLYCNVRRRRMKIENGKWKMKEWVMWQIVAEYGEIKYMNG